MNSTTKTAQPVTKIVACPNCKKSVQWTNNSQYRPFCSKRCKLIDLGDWASENHTIAGDDIVLDDD